MHNDNDNDRAAQDKVEALLELSQVQQRMELMVRRSNNTDELQ